MSTALQVGHRVKYAREAAGLTQDALKAALNFNDRQTISDIENGKREVKAGELLTLSDVFDRDVEFFVDPFTVVAEAQYSWRASDTLPKEVLDGFEQRANGWVGMLRWLREQERSAASPLTSYGLRLSEKSSFEQARRAAEELVRLLELGEVPALRLAECIESELGIPVLFVDTGERLSSGSISGAACHLQDLGVILVNRKESAARRYFDLAHELFHILTWDAMAPAHQESNAIADRKSARRPEQLANNFASALLMPTVSLDSLIDSSRAQDADHLASVAERLQVTAEALSWRLFNLQRIDEATRAKLAQHKRVDADAQAPKPFSSSFVTQLHVALDKGRVSARKAAKTLDLPLRELSALFATYEMPAPFEL